MLCIWWKYPIIAKMTLIIFSNMMMLLQSFPADQIQMSETIISMMMLKKKPDKTAEWCHISVIILYPECDIRVLPAPLLDKHCLTVTGAPPLTIAQCVSNPWLNNNSRNLLHNHDRQTLLVTRIICFGSSRPKTHFKSHNKNKGIIGCGYLAKENAFD